MLSQKWSFWNTKCAEKNGKSHKKYCTPTRYFCQLSFEKSLKKVGVFDPAKVGFFANILYFSLFFLKTQHYKVFYTIDNSHFKIFMTWKCTLTLCHFGAKYWSIRRYQCGNGVARGMKLVRSWWQRRQIPKSLYQW